ncbi:MAG: hypothetical protein WBM44_29925 [Waterburya sp.]
MSNLIFEPYLRLNYHIFLKLRNVRAKRAATRSGASCPRSIILLLFPGISEAEQEQVAYAVKDCLLEV